MQTTINTFPTQQLPSFVNMSVDAQGSNVSAPTVNFQNGSIPGVNPPSVSLPSGDSFNSLPTVTPATVPPPTDFSFPFTTGKPAFFAPIPPANFSPALATPPAAAQPINVGDIPVWAPPTLPQQAAPAAPIPFRSQSVLGAPVYAPTSPAPVARPVSSMTQPLIPTAGYDWNPAAKTLPYSAAVQLIEAGQIKHASIILDAQSFTAIPTAELDFVNGAKVKMLLPRDTAAFMTMLDENNITYEYRNNAPVGAAKVAQGLGGMAKELFVPFLMLGAAGASAAFAMKRFQQKQADSETIDSIRKAKKDLSEYKYDFNTILKDHEPPVQRALGSFMRGEKQVVVAKGLPGIGKTHVFLSLAKEIQKKDPDTFVLEIRPGVGDSVRDLLKDMYSGDRTLTLKAMKFLEKENNGKPVKDLLLYADEVEKIPGNLMEFLINNGIGNPTSTVPGLPKLRILATCNAWPNFINNSATLSRSTAVVVTPPTPRIVSKIFAENLAEALPGKVDAQKLQASLHKIFQEYDGYSPRTIAQTVTKQVANALKEDDDFSEKHIEKVLTDTLSQTPLNDTEVASLLTRLLIKDVMQGQQPLDATNGPQNLWKTLLDDAESATKGLLFLVEGNGKQYTRTIENLIRRTDLDYLKDPQAFNRAVTTISDALKTERLAGLTFTDKQLASEKELTDAYVDYLERCVEKEKANPDPKGRAQAAQTVKALETVVQQLRHIDRRSEAGQALSKAAVIYQRLRQVDDVQNPAFLDSDKLDAVFTRTLDYDPKQHDIKNDYALVSDPDYAALFKLLSRVLRLSISA